MVLYQSFPFLSSSEAEIQTLGEVPRPDLFLLLWVWISSRLQGEWPLLPSSWQGSQGQHSWQELSLPSSVNWDLFLQKVHLNNFPQCRFYLKDWMTLGGRFWNSLRELLRENFPTVWLLMPLQSSLVSARSTIHWWATLVNHTLDNHTQLNKITMHRWANRSTIH